MLSLGYVLQIESLIYHIPSLLSRTFGDIYDLELLGLL
jgi:hypothetical protein